MDKILKIAAAELGCIDSLKGYLPLSATDSKRHPDQEDGGGVGRTDDRGTNIEDRGSNIGLSIKY